jgi:hypothetical protein
VLRLFLASSVFVTVFFSSPTPPVSYWLCVDPKEDALERENMAFQWCRTWLKFSRLWIAVKSEFVGFQMSVFLWRNRVLFWIRNGAVRGIRGRNF